MVGQFYEVVNDRNMVGNYIDFPQVFKRINIACALDLVFCVEQMELFNSTRKTVQPETVKVLKLNRDNYDDDDEYKPRSSQHRFVTPGSYGATNVEPTLAKLA